MGVFKPVDNFLIAWTPLGMGNMNGGDMGGMGDMNREWWLWMGCGVYGIFFEMGSRYKGVGEFRNGGGTIPFTNYDTNLFQMKQGA